MRKQILSTIILIFFLVKLNGRFALWTQFRLRLTLLCSVDVMFYSLIGFVLYHFIGKKSFHPYIFLEIFLFKLGPWYIGYLTEESFGVSFLWGTLIQGVYLPPDSVIFTGTFQVK